MKYKVRISKYLILFTLIISNLVEQPTPDIKLHQGTVRGRLSNNGDFFEYLGIPYGTANSSNRFQAPFSPPPWEGTLYAINEHYRCPQLLGSLFIGAEDCLKLNIYAPVYATSSTPLPVMIFIHGGGFLEGSGSRLLYGPDFFIRHGVILVTFNYRIGALGFLCLRTKSAPGNAGLRDQLAALKWVKNNIKAFGGDPDNVTVFGESAGSVSVSYMHLNQQFKGLFNRSILQSGSSTSGWALTHDPLKSASIFAAELGFNTSDPNELLQIFNKTSAKILVSTKPSMGNVTNVATNRIVFAPCIEKPFPEVERIITENPFKTFKSGNYTKLPVIRGYNDKEGIFLVGKETEQSLHIKNKAEYLPNDLFFESNVDRQQMNLRVKEMYFGNKAISKETKLNLAEMYSDLFFIMPIIFEAEMVSLTSNVPQYNYVFKYGGYRNIVKVITGFGNENGSSHADELFYMFRSNLLPHHFNEDRIVIDQLTTMWTNFAKFGNPTPKSLDMPITWRHSEEHNVRYLIIDKDISMGEPPNQHRIRFWNETYNQYRRSP